MPRQPPVDPAEQEKLLEILARHRDSLLDLPGVHQVDVGLRMKAGRPAGGLAIRVHVADKLPESALPASAVAPKEVEGAPVDVIVSSKRLE